MRKNKKRNSPLTLRERTIIEVRYRDGNSIRSIAKEINKNPSTIFREIDGKPPTCVGKYIADVSHRKALKCIARRGNKYKLDKNEDLKESEEPKKDLEKLRDPKGEILCRRLKIGPR